MQNKTRNFIISSPEDLETIDFDIQPWDIVFFYWDLWAGKTTSIRSIIRNFLNTPTLVVRSPTYTYYQEYSSKNTKLYHFDLYRIDSLETFYLIGWNDIVSDTTAISLIEWPEILGESVTPTKKIYITHNASTEERHIRIEQILADEKR